MPLGGCRSKCRASSLLQAIVCPNDRNQRDPRLRPKLLEPVTDPFATEPGQTVSRHVETSGGADCFTLKRKLERAQLGIVRYYSSTRSPLSLLQIDLGPESGKAKFPGTWVKRWRKLNFCAGTSERRPFQISRPYYRCLRWAVSAGGPLPPAKLLN